MGLLRIKLDADNDFAALASDAALLAQPFAHAVVGRGAAVAVASAALADMPSAPALEILLPASAVRTVRTKVPRVTGAALRRVLPNLVEDSVVGAVADCHIALMPGFADDGLRDVAVVGREWMQLAQRIVQLRKPRRAVAVSEAMLAPFVPFIWVDGTRGYLRHAKGVLPLSIGADGEVPAELRLARPLLGAGPVETGGLGREQAARWAQALGVQLAGASWHWVDAHPVDPSWSLLQHEYARGSHAGGAPLREWRWPLAIGAACLAAAIGGINAHWWMLARESHALEARIDADFRTAFPAITTVIDPVAQARRQIAVATGGRDEPYFQLTGALAEALGEPTGAAALVRSLEYRAGNLRARLAPGTDAAQAAERARAAGFEASAESGAQDGAPVIVLRRKAA